MEKEKKTKKTGLIGTGNTPKYYLKKGKNENITGSNPSIGSEQNEKKTKYYKDQGQKHPKKAEGSTSTYYAELGSSIEEREGSTYTYYHLNQNNKPKNNLISTSATHYAELVSRISSLENSVSQLQRIIQKKGILQGIKTKNFEIEFYRILKDKGILTSFDVMGMYDYSQSVSGRRLMKKYAKMYPEIAVYDPGNARRSAALKWVGWENTQEKLEAFLQRNKHHILNEGYCLMAETVRKNYLIKSEEEFQEFCRALPRNIVLKKRIHGWRIERK